MRKVLAVITVIFAASLISPAQGKGEKESYDLSDPSQLSSVGVRWIEAERRLGEGKDALLKTRPAAEGPLLSLKIEHDLGAGNPQRNQRHSKRGVTSGVFTPDANGEQNEFQMTNVTRSDNHGFHHPRWKMHQNSGGHDREVAKSARKPSPTTRVEFENVLVEDSGGFAGDRARRDPVPLRGGFDDSVGPSIMQVNRFGPKPRGWRRPTLAMRETRRRTRRAAARTHPPSPCPGVFSYLREGPRGGKWYGTITVATRQTIHGVTLSVQLDKPALLIGAWLGAVQTENKKDFIISNKEKIVTPNSPLSAKILVQFNEGDLQPPRIKKIIFNGMQICPASNAPFTTKIQSTGGKQEVTDEMVDGVPCGQAEPKPSFLIANGQPTERGEWPWHAAIYDATKSKLMYICGGSIIGKNKILTAAHCVTERKGRKDVAVSPRSLLVSLGKFHLSIDEEDVQIREVEKIHVHTEYSRNQYQADIAILVLSLPLEFTEYVKPVCLWNGNRPHLSEIEGQGGVVVGWGFDENGNLSENLMMGKMPVVSQQTCIWSNPQFFSRYTTDRTFCAGYRNGTSACNGDSGGGMFFPKKVPGKADTLLMPLTWKLRGIVSLSVSQETKRICDTKQYVIFTDVAKYYYWIKQFL